MRALPALITASLLATIAPPGIEATPDYCDTLHQLDTVEGPDLFDCDNPIPVDPDPCGTPLILLAQLPVICGPVPPVDPCDVAVINAQAAFAPYNETGVPHNLAGTQVAAVTASCYDPGLVVDTVVGLVEEVKKFCSGGGASVIGWRDYIVVRGQQFQVLPSPASSHWELWGEPSDWDGLGYTRSILDDIEGAGIGASHVYTWSFGPVPMGGEIYLAPNCVGPVLTSMFVEVEGTPLGVDENVLKVLANGRTCLLPC
jgi:hypothetical protein